MEVEVILEEELDNLLDNFERRYEFPEYERIITSEYSYRNRAEFMVHFLDMSYGSLPVKVLDGFREIKGYLRRKNIKDYLITIPFQYDAASIEGRIIHETNNIHMSSIIADLNEVYESNFDVVGISFEDLIEEAYMRLLRISETFFLECGVGFETRYVIYEDKGALVCIPMKE